MSRIQTTFEDENISSTFGDIIEIVHQKIDTIMPSRNNLTYKCRAGIILPKNAEQD